MSDDETIAIGIDGGGPQLTSSAIILRDGDEYHCWNSRQARRAFRMVYRVYGRRVARAEQRSRRNNAARRARPHGRAR